MSRRPVALIMFIGPPDRNVAISQSLERARGREPTGKKGDRWAPIFTGEKIRDRDDEQLPSVPLKVAAAAAVVIIGHGSITTAGIARK